MARTKKQKRILKKIPHWVLSMNVALGFFAVVILTTMMLPGIFGFQNVRQWAGMYIDNWCQATVYSGDPKIAETKSMNVTVGRYDWTREVWTAPSHNQYTCARWVYDMMCGQSTTEGWTVAFARPFFLTDGYYLGDFNLCKYPFTGLPWFTHAQKL